MIHDFDAANLPGYHVQVASQHRPGKARATSRPQNPQDVLTAHDICRYFLEHASAPPDDPSRSKQFHLNRAISSGHAWQPYDLVVVEPHLADDKEHFIMSSQTLVRMAAGQLTDCLTLGDWCREVEQFQHLRRLQVFGNFIIRNCFINWRQGLRTKLFRRVRAQTCSALITAVPSFYAVLVEVSTVALQCATVRLITLRAGHLYILDEFMQLQMAVRDEQSKVELGNNLTQAVQALSKLVAKIVAAANAARQSVRNTADLNDTTGVEKTEYGKAPRPMNAIKAGKIERARIFRQTGAEEAMLPKVVRLADSIVTEAIVELVIASLESFAVMVDNGVIDTSVGQQGLFRITAEFEVAGAIATTPSKEELLASLQQVVTDNIDMANGLPRVAECEKLQQAGICPFSALNSIARLISDSPRLAAVQQRLQQAVSRDFHAALDAAAFLADIRPIHDFLSAWDPATYSDGTKSVEDIRSALERFETWEAELEAMRTSHVSGCICIDFHAIQGRLRPQLAAAGVHVRSALLQLARKRCADVTADLAARSAQVEARPDDLQDFMEFQAMCQRQEEEAEAALQACGAVDDVFELLAYFNYPVPSADQIRHDDLAEAVDTFRAASSRATKFLAAEAPAQTAKLAIAVSEVTAAVAELGREAESGIWSDAESAPAEAVEQLLDLTGRIQDLKESAAQCQAYQRANSLPAEPFSELTTVSRAVAWRTAIWRALASALGHLSHVTTSPILDDGNRVQLDIEEACSDMATLEQKAQTLAEDHASDAVVEKLHMTLARFSEVLPLLQLLTNPALRERHWHEVFSTLNLQKTIGRDEAGVFDVFCINDLVGAGAGQHLEPFAALVVSAEAEASLELQFAGMAAEWTVFQPTASSVAGGDVPLLDDADRLQDLADKQCIEVDKSCASPHARPLAAQLAEARAKAQAARGLLSACITCHRAWELRPLFAASDAVDNIPLACSTFGQAVQDWRTVVKRITAAGSWREVVEQLAPELQKQLTGLVALLDAAQAELPSYLEVHRKTCPRLSVLDDAKLTALLCKPPDCQPSEDAVKACFLGIRRFSWAKRDEGRAATGCVLQGEYQLAFTAPVQFSGNLCAWMAEVEQAMALAMQAAVAAVGDITSDRGRTALLRSPVQVACAALRHHLSQGRDMTKVQGMLYQAASQNTVRYMADMLSQVLGIHKATQQVVQSSDHSAGAQTPGWLLPGFPAGSEIASAPQQLLCEATALKAAQLAQLLPKADLAIAVPGDSKGTSAALQMLACTYGRRLIEVDCADSLPLAVLQRAVVAAVQGNWWLHLQHSSYLDDEVFSMVLQWMTDLAAAAQAGTATARLQGCESLEYGKDFRLIISGDSSPRLLPSEWVPACFAAKGNQQISMQSAKLSEGLVELQPRDEGNLARGRKPYEVLRLSEQDAPDTAAELARGREAAMKVLLQGQHVALVGGVGKMHLAQQIQSDCHGSKRQSVRLKLSRLHTWEAVRQLLQSQLVRWPGGGLGMGAGCPGLLVIDGFSELPEDVKVRLSEAITNGGWTDGEGGQCRMNGISCLIIEKGIACHRHLPVSLTVQLAQMSLETARDVISARFSSQLTAAAFPKNIVALASLLSAATLDVATFSKLQHDGKEVICDSSAMRKAFHILQGMMLLSPSMLPPDSGAAEAMVVRLWAHEAAHVISNRCCDQGSAEEAIRHIQSAAHQHFGLDIDVAAIAFGDILDSSTPPKYGEMTSLAACHAVLETSLRSYIGVSKRIVRSERLPLLEQHVLRMLRVLRLGSGHAVLQGGPGSGRRCSARLAAFIAGCRVVEVDTHVFMAAELWRDKLATAIEAVAMKPNQMMLLIGTDCPEQAAAGWLDVHNLVANNDCRHLLPAGRHMEVLKQLRATHPLGELATDGDLWQHLTSRLQTQMHVVLCTSWDFCSSLGESRWHIDCFRDLSADEMKLLCNCHAAALQSSGKTAAPADMWPALFTKVASFVRGHGLQQRSAHHLLHCLDTWQAESSGARSEGTLLQNTAADSVVVLSTKGASIPEAVVRLIARIAVQCLGSEWDVHIREQLLACVTAAAGESSTEAASAQASEAAPASSTHEQAEAKPEHLSDKPSDRTQSNTMPVLEVGGSLVQKDGLAIASLAALAAAAASGLIPTVVDSDGIGAAHLRSLGISSPSSLEVRWDGRFEDSSAMTSSLAACTTVVVIISDCCLLAPLLAQLLFLSPALAMTGKAPSSAKVYIVVEGGAVADVEPWCRRHVALVDCGLFRAGVLDRFEQLVHSKEFRQSAPGEDVYPQLTTDGAQSAAPIQQEAPQELAEQPWSANVNRHQLASKCFDVAYAAQAVGRVAPAALLPLATLEGLLLAVTSDARADSANLGVTSDARLLSLRFAAAVCSRIAAALPSQLHLLFPTVLWATTELRAGQAVVEAWTEFLRQGVNVTSQTLSTLSSPPSREDPAPDWIEDESWQTARAAEAALPALQGLCASLATEAEAWRHAVNDAKMEDALDVFPEAWSSLDTMHRLVVLRCIRPAALGQVLKAVLLSSLGSDCIPRCPTPATLLSDMLAQTTSLQTPLLITVVTPSPSFLSAVAELAAAAGTGLRTATLTSATLNSTTTRLREAAAGGNWLSVMVVGDGWETAANVARVCSMVTTLEFMPGFKLIIAADEAARIPSSVVRQCVRLHWHSHTDNCNSNGPADASTLPDLLDTLRACDLVICA